MPRGGSAVPQADTRAAGETRTFCGPGNKAAYCHFGCLNEIEVVSRTHVRIKQTVSRTGSSPITPPVKDGTYFCEFRKKS